MAATITGDKKLDKKLARLGDKSAKKVARASVRKGLTLVAKAIRSEAPVGKTKNLKKSIGSRFAKAKGGQNKGTVQARAGVNVGKKKKQQAPHSHLVALGTKSRKRKTIGGKFAYLNPASDQQRSAGAMPPNNFVERGFNKSEASAEQKIRSSLLEGIAKEAAKG